MIILAVNMNISLELKHLIKIDTATSQEIITTKVML